MPDVIKFLVTDSTVIVVKNGKRVAFFPKSDVSVKDDFKGLTLSDGISNYPVKDSDLDADQYDNSTDATEKLISLIDDTISGLEAQVGRRVAKTERANLSAVELAALEGEDENIRYAGKLIFQGSNTATKLGYTVPEDDDVVIFDNTVGVASGAISGTIPVRGFNKAISVGNNQSFIGIKYTFEEE